MLIDSHAHIDFPQFDQDRSQVLEGAARAGVGLIINPGTDLLSSRRSIELAEEHSFVFSAVGVHPHDVKKLPADYLEQLLKLAAAAKVVAIGEIGLDYYRDLSPRNQQKSAFREQLRLARRLHLPVIIHDRDAHDDVVRILEEEGVEEIGGVMHCFSGDLNFARRCLDLNFYISFAGPLTYKNAHKLKELARFLPLDRILVETDCPYLTPEPYRGERNEPAQVLQVCSTLAQLRGLSREKVAEETTRNALRLFQIDY
ncbi:MAG: TatD family hydrolase [Dethiobacteria bacterium]|nr:TatD family hydrolase [Bacillota bacterium]